MEEKPNHLSDNDSRDSRPHEEVSMSEENNKHVRDMYRNLIQSVQEQAVEGGGEVVPLDTLHAMVRKANEAFNEVKRPREAAMDAKLLKTCGALAKLNIESSQSNLRIFKPCEFARKLISFATPDDDKEDQGQLNSLAHLVRFGKAVTRLYKSAIGVEPMYSAMEWERPSKPATRVREKVKDAEATTITKPTEIATSSQEEEGETEVVSRMYKVLKQRYHEAGNNPLCFFSFVVNPSSYSHTVENLFNTSLLVREQFASISEDDRGLPVISPLDCNRPQVGGTCKQCIISLSKSEWKEIVSTFEIKKAMIPPPKRSLKRK